MIHCDEIFAATNHSGGIVRHNFDSDINFEFPDDMIARMARAQKYLRDCVRWKNIRYIF